MVSAIFDQLKRCDHTIIKQLKTPHNLRLFICSKLRQQLDENHIFWVSNTSPDVWLKKMETNGEWGDDVFLQIAANIFDKNVILIPLSASSAHHGGMYSDIRSVHGGTGDPFFMLYFEEWRQAGHYQSLEIDPNVDMNRVMAHYAWRNKCLTRSFSRTLSFSQPSIAHPPPPLPPPSHSLSPLYSTRQRLESDTAGLTFANAFSPIRREPQEDTEQAVTSVDVTLPQTINCEADKCQHVVIYGKHFDTDAWNMWTAANDTINGDCEFCGLAMGPMRGVPKHQRLQHHILRKCMKYQNTTEHSEPTQPSSSQPLPPSSSTSPSPPPGPSAPPSYTSKRNAVKPKPVTCKKKKSECTHVVAFGEHFNKTAWKAYSDFLSTQHADTPLPDDLI